MWEIPETVFKEAIINALAHRDYYDKGAVINIEVFDDRVEISNPGGLVSAIPESEFGKRSHSRNPLIFGLFARMHFVEQVGSGIGRIRDLMKEAGLPLPVFQKEGIFTVTLYRPGNVSGQTTLKTTLKTEDRIIEILSLNPQASRTEMADALGGITEDGVKYQLNKLKKQGRIARVGPDKGGYWEVINKEP
ncbi:MAG: ATP-binding protein [Synechococcales cyanobacterium]